MMLFALPVLYTPFLMADAPKEGMAHNLVLFYPAYVIVSAICALICYGKRPEVSWILVALMLLTDIGMWVLVQ